jgi:L-lactate permease
VFAVAIAVLIAILVYGMPVSMALTATVYGFFYGLWPISWIIVAAVFLYKLTVKTGQFEIIRSSVLTITEDQRLQMVLVGSSLPRIRRSTNSTSSRPPAPPFS